MNLEVLGYLVLVEDSKGKVYGRDVFKNRIIGKIDTAKNGEKVLTIYKERKNYDKNETSTRFIIID